MFHHTYWLPGHPRKNSVTGKESAPERGPFCLCMLGCALREVTKQEFEAHVLGLHGELPVRTETTEVK
jgi:hypothetical protein